MSGITQSGAWRAFRNIGDARAPRSAGCSSMYSAPAAYAACNKLAVRLTISFACSSSRGGPPSATSALRYRRDTENVEQGGDAMTAA
eukprot:3481488-Pleurochrysis_carterae.AAC.1